LASIWTLSKNYCAELQLSVFSISYGGRSDIDYHLETKKQNSSVEAAMSSTLVTHFFKAADSDEPLLFAAKDATCVYHAATYGQSFKSADCNLSANFKFFRT